jgi:glycosyltransferase involved in cell wall biosynthesis
MGSEKQIAVLLATYNGSEFLSKFLDSLVLQRLKSFVVYVRDDCSSDCTLDIVRSYASKLDIVVLRGDKRLGAAFNFLALLREAGSEHEYYAFADQDDYWHENKLERACAALEHLQGRPGLYFSRVEYVDRRLEHLSFSPVPRYTGIENALVENVAMGCASMINRAARELVVNTTPNAVIMHDWWIYAIMSALGCIVSDDFVSLQYRQHGNNTIGVSVSKFDEYKTKVSRFLRRDRGVFRVSDQANQLRICYGDRLNRHQRDMVDMLAAGKTSVLSRLRLCILSPFVRQRVIDTLILKVLFLLNRY